MIINNDIQNYFPAMLGLLVTSIWLAYKLEVIKFLLDLIKVNDEKEILLPSLLFLISPFVFTYFAGFIRYDNASDFFKPLLPLITFILGQYITRFDKQKEKQLNQEKLTQRLTTLLNIKGSIGIPGR